PYRHPRARHSVPTRRSSDLPGERRHDVDGFGELTHTTFKVGRLTCHALEAGLQHLDGGAMFGIVPKALWARRAPPDERNRIPLADRKSTRLNSSHQIISYAV